MVDWTRTRPAAAFRQIADEIHTRIADGDLRPGDRIPSIDLLTRQYGVGPVTAEKALRELATRGLIDTESGRVGRVRKPGPREVVVLGSDDEATPRTPTPREVDEMDLPPGVQVVEVHAGGVTRLVRADRVILRGA